MLTAAIWLVAVLLLVIAVRKMRQTRGRLGVGVGGAGAVYGMLNEDKRRAIEIIVEEKAEARDPEDKDGDLPRLEEPRRRR